MCYNVKILLHLYISIFLKKMWKSSIFPFIIILSNENSKVKEKATTLLSVMKEMKDGKF